MEEPGREGRGRGDGVLRRVLEKYESPLRRAAPGVRCAGGGARREARARLAPCIFDACVSRALDAVLASRKALEGIKAGFGVARGLIFEGCGRGRRVVGVAARSAPSTASFSLKPAARVDRHHGLRTVPVTSAGQILRAYTKTQRAASCATVFLLCACWGALFVRSRCMVAVGDRRSPQRAS